jgi:hypothetical protein
VGVDYDNVDVGGTPDSVVGRAGGQVVYRPRRGDFITKLKIEDLAEIYALREILEERARRSVAALEKPTPARCPVPVKD